MSGSSPGGYQTLGGTAYVGYTATVFPVAVKINLTGTTTDANGNPNILVGQGCTASLAATGCTINSYQWSVSGTTFQIWAVAEGLDSKGNPVTSSTTFTPGMGPTSNSTAHWYWSDAANSETVTCIASVTPTGQNPLSLTVTKTVNLQAPAINVTPAVGRVQINNLSNAYSSDGSYLYSLYDGASANSSRGINWSVQVNTPALFTSQGASLWNFVQTVTPSFSRTPDGGKPQPSVVNGESGLDATYPYDPAPFSGQFPGGHSADNLLWKMGDSPGFPVGDAYSNYQVTDNFSTYVMYRPPGSDTQWVPLWSIGWYWTANVTRPGASWSLWNNANDAGIVRAPSSHSETIHPLWSYLVLPPPPGGW